MAREKAGNTGSSNLEFSAAEKEEVAAGEYLWQLILSALCMASQSGISDGREREEIQCNAHMNRKQNRVGSPVFWSVEEVAKEIPFACSNMIKHESLCCIDRSAMPRSIAMDAHFEGGLRTTIG